MNLNNLKGASLKENHMMTTSHDALRTTFIIRISIFTNNLNFLINQNTYKMTCDSKIILYGNITLPHSFHSIIAYYCSMLKLCLFSWTENITCLSGNSLKIPKG